MDIKLINLILKNNKKGTPVTPVRTTVKAGMCKVGMFKVGETR
ncbi:MAG TPA: hypothetical protein VIK72_19210 [Clostridiaceae bacterium]